MADQPRDEQMSAFLVRRHTTRAILLFAVCCLIASTACRRSSRSSAGAATGSTPEGAPPPITPAQPVAEASAIPPSAIPQNPAMAPAIKKAVERYFNELGQAPYTCQDLVQKKYLPSLPLAQNGQPLDLNLFLAHHNTR